MIRTRSELGDVSAIEAVDAIGSEHAPLLQMTRSVGRLSVGLLDVAAHIRQVLGSTEEKKKYRNNRRQKEIKRDRKRTKRNQSAVNPSLSLAPCAHLQKKDVS